MRNLEGTWESRYQYSGGESVHRVHIEEVDDKVLANSLPQDDGSILSMELGRDGAILSGAWRERTAPTGPYKGAVFTGHVEFVLNETETSADGLWIGHNSDKTSINSGSWSLKKIR